MLYLLSSPPSNTSYELYGVPNILLAEEKAIWAFWIAAYSLRQIYELHEV